MRNILLLMLVALLVTACDKAPEPAKKAPLRYRAESQRAKHYMVTIWSVAPTVAVGTNSFKLQFQTAENQPADPGKVTIEPILVEKGKTTIPGHGQITPTSEAGVYDVLTELPAPGRWRFNVEFAEERLSFYYNAAKEGAPRGAGSDETHRSN